MAYANLNNTPLEVVTGMDNIVIVDVLQTIRGGRTLDVTGFTPKVIKAGHVVIQDPTTKEYKPMPVSGANYATLPTDHKYIGVVISSVETSKPMVSILVRGTVNPAASPYPLTTILTAVKTALPLIDFRED